MKFFRKEINLSFKEMAIELESDPESGIIIMRFKEFVIDQEKTTTPEYVYYKQKNTFEVYPFVEEVKEIIKALQQILPEDESNE